MLAAAMYKRDLDTALLLAVEKSQPKVVKSLLDAGARLSAKNKDYPDDHNAIELAARRGYWQCVEILATHFHDSNNTLRFSNVLFIAVASHQLEIVKLLLDAGATLSVQKDDRNAIELAATRGYWDCVEIIAARFKDTGNKLKFGDVLLTAIMSDRPAMVKLLLNAGASLLENYSAYTAVELAARGGFWTCIEVIAAQFHDTDNKFKFGTALLIAVERNLPEKVKLLLDSGAVLLENAFGHNAIEDAAFRNHWDCVAVIAKHCKDTDNKLKFDNALSIAARRNQPEIVKILLDSGATLSLNSSGYNAIEEAALLGHWGCVEVIAKSFKDANNSLKFGNVLLKAVARNQPEMIQLLLSAGATISGNTSGRHAIEYAALLGHWDCVEAMVKHGKATSSNVRLEKTLLTAVTSNRPQVVKLLLDSGASLSEEIYGSNAIEEASYRGYWGCVQVIAEKINETLDVIKDTGAKVDLERFVSNSRAIIAKWDASNLRLSDYLHGITVYFLMPDNIQAVILECLDIEPNKDKRPEEHISANANLFFKPANETSIDVNTLMNASVPSTSPSV